MLTFSLLGILSCTGSGGGGESTESAGGSGGSESGGDEFAGGSESGYITAANLASTDTECVPIRDDLNRKSILTCYITVDNAVAGLNLAPVTATGKEEGIVITWPAQPTRKFGTFANQVQCATSNEDLIYTCEFLETNIAVDVIVQVTVSKPSQNLTKSIVSEVEFENECDDLPFTSVYNAYGEGTVENPYLFCYSEQWNSFALASGAGTAQQRAAVLASHIRIGRDLLDIGSTPMVGIDTEPFTGVLQGNGFTLEGININNENGMGDVSGLFRYTDGAVIEYFTIENITMLDNWTTGVLIGIAKNTKVSQVRVLAGPITGFEAGAIASRLTLGSIVQDSIIGPITINASDYGGGVTSLLDATSKIIRTSSSANVSVSIANAGGLVGITQGTIQDSYAIGNVYSESGPAGGLIGATIYNSQPIILERSFAIGAVTTSFGTRGGIIGDMVNAPDVLNNNFWDLNTSGLSNAFGGGIGDFAPGILGKTTSEMKTQSTFTNFDFDTVWIMDAVTGYPILRTAPF